MNIWDEKNSIEPEKNSSNNNEQEPNDITISTPKSCGKNGCESIGWTRNCPKCNKVLLYKTETLRNKFDRKSTLCFECSRVSSTDKWTRSCPVCNKKIVYNRQSNFCRAKTSNSVCFDCGKILTSRFRGKKHSSESNEKRRNAMTGKKFSNDVKKAASVRMIGNKNSLGKPKPEHWRKNLIKKMSDAYSCRSNIGKSFLPNYNKTACEYFDWLNKWMCWDGQYATYKGEKNVLTYFVDYYEPTLNIVIEWDEKYHTNRKQKESDIIRQTLIKNTLGCRFFRYNELTNEIREV